MSADEHHSSSSIHSGSLRNLSRALLEETIPCLSEVNEVLKDESLIVTKFLASGGAGDLFVGRQENLDREVAIKLIPLDDVEGDEEAFLREGKILALLQHPNIVSVHDALLVGEADERYCCLVLELVSGRDLGQTDITSAAEVLPLMIRICDAVDYAHEKNVVHCDLKPGNILIDREGTPKIADFGISRMIDESEGGFFLVGGDHLAPEQTRLDCDPGDPRRDFFSLGVLLGSLLDRLPEAEKQSALIGRLSEIAEKASHKNPGQRHPSAKEMRVALEALQPTARATPGKILAWSGLAFIVAVTAFSFFQEEPRPPAQPKKPLINLPVFSNEKHPLPTPVITDVSPTEILKTEKGFWLEIRGINFVPEQNYYCHASDLRLKNLTPLGNARAEFISETLLRVFVERVSPEAGIHSTSAVSLRWGPRTSEDACKKFPHAFAITSEERN